MPTINHIWLIRHGETPWSLSGQHTGKTEMELTPVGQAMAKAVACGGWLWTTAFTSGRAL